MAEKTEKEPKKTAAKKTTKSASARYSYEDIVKSNQEVRDALAALNARLDTMPENSVVYGMLDRQSAAIGELSSRPAAAPDGNQTKVLAETAAIVSESLAEQRARIDDLLTAVRGSAPAPADASPYLTSREQFDLYNKIMGRHDAEFADKQFTLLLEQICAMREDFKRLCSGMEQNLGGMSAQDVFSSFKCYMVDMDNMLKDAGVRFGAFGGQEQKADPAFQRIIGVVPTDDAAKDGTVAKRLSSGYEYKGRAVYKERVMIYRARRG